MSITPDQEPIFTLTTGPVDAYPQVLRGLSRPRDARNRSRQPLLIASIVAEAITPLMPGAGPPPTRIARVSTGGESARAWHDFLPWQALRAEEFLIPPRCWRGWPAYRYRPGTFEPG